MKAINALMWFAADMWAIYQLAFAENPDTRTLFQASAITICASIWLSKGDK